VNGVQGRAWILLAQVKNVKEISESVKGPEILEELNNH
jgi:hypothetical protein